MRRSPPTFPESAAWPELEIAVDLKQRLARFDKPAGGRRQEAAPAASTVRPAVLRRELGLELRETPAGDVWIAEERLTGFPPPRLPDADAPGGGLGAVLTAAAPAGAAAGDLLLLDAETTGLSGGAGTIAFLIGTAWWLEGRLRLRQFFLPSPGGEAAMLAEFAALAERFAVLVSFNGNSYDLPLLRSRGIMAGRRRLLGNALSWDLLPAVRRLWGRSLPDCRQRTVETALADVGRPPGDIEGGRIPQAWFDFVRAEEGSAAAMRDVLAHNRHDLAGMAAILGRVCAETAALDRVDPGGVPDWRDRWARARICERAGLRGQASRWIESALSARGHEGSPPLPPDRMAAMDRDAVRLLKRTADWPLVRSVLDGRLGGGDGSDWVLREAAMLYEHRLGDPAAALDLALRLGEKRRIDRLRRRLGPDSS